MGSGTAVCFCWSQKTMDSALEGKKKMVQQGLALLFVCCVLGVWVGMESSLLNTPPVLWVWLQTDGLMAQSNKQSLDIRFKSLCFVKDEMQAPSLFMSQWLCNMSVRYWKGWGVCCHPILCICSPSSTQRLLSRWSLTEQELAHWAS